MGMGACYGNSANGNTEKQIEQEIQDKGLNAPRLTPEYINSCIFSEHYFTAEQGVRQSYKDNNDVHVGSAITEKSAKALPCLTFCILVLNNGFTVTGESACASPENFDAEIGCKIAYDNARNKIWALEGYLLKERLFKQEDATDIGIALASTSEPPVPTAVNCGESSGTVGEAKSCSGNVSYGNTNHRTIELLLEILRGTNVGGDVTDKARAKLSELVDNI